MQVGDRVIVTRYDKDRKKIRSKGIIVRALGKKNIRIGIANFRELMVYEVDVDGVVCAIQEMLLSKEKE